MIVSQKQKFLTYVLTLDTYDDRDKLRDTYHSRIKVYSHGKALLKMTMIIFL